MLNENEKFWSLKRIFALPKLDTKKICTIGLLIAVTFVLSYISGYIRIGNISKLSVSFISVFVTAYLFGPVTGGGVAAAADIISFLVNPTGAFLPQLTLIEFLYGFLYGVLFYRLSDKTYILKTVCIAVIQTLVNMILKTYVLSLFYGPFKAMFISRIPMCALQMAIIILGLVLVKPFLAVFKKRVNSR